jgi:hypothetical protein
MGKLVAHSVRGIWIATPTIGPISRLPAKCHYSLSLNILITWKWSNTIATSGSLSVTAAIYAEDMSIATALDLFNRLKKGYPCFYEWIMLG